MTVIAIFGGMVLIASFALHIAWIAKRAEARGRSALAWVALGIALVAVALRGGIELLDRAPDVHSSLLQALCLTAPFTLGLAPLLGIVLVLLALPVHVSIGMAWPVFETLAGAGKLVIEEDAIELRWAARTDRIARAGLSADSDMETLRLTWHDGPTVRELALMPTGKPANREGRARQAEVLAARLRS